MSQPPYKMGLLAFGDNGWGDELFFATLMTLAVAITAMFIGFIFSLIFTPLKITNNKILNFVGNFYTTVIRGVPELLVIYLFLVLIKPGWKASIKKNNKQSYITCLKIQINQYQSRLLYWPSLLFSVI